MNTGFAVPPSGGLDLVSVGALVHRLDPGIVPWRKATSCQIHVSGGEFNVAANLADCFRMKTGIATAMVKYPIGDMIHERVRAMGVVPFYKYFEHDGVTGPNMATVYSDRGYGVRGPVVFYNRSNEAAAMLRPGDLDWSVIFQGGVRWLHSGGIFAALSPTTGEVIIEAMKAAKQAGAICSFDLNFREKLWNLWGSGEEAAEIVNRIASHADVLIGMGNEEEFRTGFAISRQVPTDNSDLDPSQFSATLEKLVARFPQVKVVATTLRKVDSANRHRWAAAAWANGQTHVTPTYTLDVYDRVGGGDGFASGMIYGLLAGESVSAAVKLGWAHGALLTTTPGDTTMVTLEQVQAFAEGETARIQR